MTQPNIETVRTLIELAFACCATEDQTTDQRDACALLLAVAHNVVAHITDGAPISGESSHVLRRLGAMPVAAPRTPFNRSIQ